jgi:hypothetical protein
MSKTPVSKFFPFIVRFSTAIAIVEIFPNFMNRPDSGSFLSGLLRQTRPLPLTLDKKTSTDYVVNAPGHRERVFEIVFEGDPNIDERMRADAANEESAFSIRTLTRDQQGVLRCAQDVKMRKQ